MTCSDRRRWSANATRLCLCPSQAANASLTHGQLLLCAGQRQIRLAEPGSQELACDAGRPACILGGRGTGCRARHQPAALAAS